MASKRRLRRKSCEGKKHYDSADEANEACKALLRHKGESTHVYRCPFRSSKYHVGHPDKRTRRAYAQKTGVW